MTDRAAFAIETEREGSAIRLRLSGELDLAHADSLRAALRDAEAGEPARIVIDLERLEFIDSTGIGLLLEAGERLRESKSSLDIIPGTGQVETIIRMAGLRELLPFVD